MTGTTTRRALTALVSAAAVGPLLTVLATPLLTRLFAPDAVGTAATVVAWASLLSVVATARLELLVPGAPTDRDARTLVHAGLWSATAVCLLAGVVATLVGDTAASPATTTSPRVADTALMGAAVAWALAASALLRAGLVRAQAFTRAAEVQGWQGALRALLPLAGGVVWPGVASLLLGELLARALPLVRAVPRVEAPARVRAADALRSALPAAAVLLPSGLLDALTIALPLPLVGRLHGAAAAGLFALAQRLVSAPAALVAPAVGDVLHGTAAAAVRDGTAALRPALRTATRRLALGGGVLLLLIAGVAPAIMGPLFGAAWRDAAPLLPPLALWAWAALVVVPTSRLLVLAGRASWKLGYDTGALLLLLATTLGAPGASLVDTVWRVALGQVVAYAGYAWLIDRACAHPRPHPASTPTPPPTPTPMPVA